LFSFWGGSLNSIDRGELMKLFRNTNFWKFFSVLGLAVLTAAGCGSSSSTAYTSSLRVVHASANSPNVDVLNEGQGFVANLPFSFASPYLGVSPKTQKLGVYQSGTQFTPPLFPITDVSTPSGSVTSVYVINDYPTVAPLVTTDNLTPPAAGQANIRLLHLAPDVPGQDAAVDVYLTAPGVDLTTLAPPLAVDGLKVFLIATNVPYAGNDATNGITGYIPLNASASGTKYELQIFPAGTVNTPAKAAIDSVITVKSTQIRTILALDKAFPTTGAPTLTFQAAVLNDLN
jgi:hypothetical protein